MNTDTDQTPETFEQADRHTNAHAAYETAGLDPDLRETRQESPVAYSDTSSHRHEEPRASNRDRAGLDDRWNAEIPVPEDNLDLPLPQVTRNSQGLSGADEISWAPQRNGMDGQQSTLDIASHRQAAPLDDHIDKPDHPCNYCKEYHWFSGPGATACPEGTVIPRNKQFRHQRHDFNGPRVDREHLPDSDCVKCRTRHWYSGPKATPCPPRSALGSERYERSHSRTDHPVNSMPRPERPCTYCGEYHWVTGPNRSACDPVARKNHQQSRKFQQRTDDTRFEARRNRQDLSPDRGGYDARRREPSSRDESRQFTERYNDRAEGRSDERIYEQRRPSDYVRPPAITKERIYRDDYGREVIERIIEAPYEPYPRAMAHTAVDGYPRGKYGNDRAPREYVRPAHRDHDRDALRSERRRSISPLRRGGKYSPSSPEPRHLRDMPDPARNRKPYANSYDDSRPPRRDYLPRTDSRALAPDYRYDDREDQLRESQMAYHEDDRYGAEEGYASARHGRNTYDVRSTANGGRYR